MKNPSRILAIAAAVLVATPLIGDPPTRVPPQQDTFNLTVTPTRDLYDWSLGVVRESVNPGIYTLDVLSGFPDLIGEPGDGISTYTPYTTEVTMTRPGGVGNFGYFIIGRYQPEIPPDTETGVTIGMSPTWATTYINDASEWTVPFPGILEASVHADIGAGWVTSASANNTTFLGQLFAIATQSANAMGSVGGPTSLNLTLVTFSEADQGGSALLSFNPIPEASTVASGLALLGMAGVLAWRRSQKKV
jgi:hypothetical protein